LTAPAAGDRISTKQVEGDILDLSTSKPGKTTIWNRNFICVMLTNVFLGFSNSSVNTLVSTFAKFLGAGIVLVGALTGMFFGVSFAMRPVAGPITTKLDKRRLMIFSFALGAVANLGYALTRDVGLFIVFRVLSGIQYSIVGSLAMTVASDSVPPEKLGSGIGIYGIAAAIAMALGPALGIAIQDYGTRLRDESFGFMLVFLFAALCLAVGLIPCFLLRLQKRSKEELASTGAWYKNIVAVKAIVPAVIVMLLAVSYSTLGAYLYPYAQALGIAGIGTYFTVYAVVLLVARPLSGRFIDKFGACRMILIGAAIFAVSFIIVALGRSLPALLCAAAIAALGYGSTQPAVQTMCFQLVTPVKRAVASNTNYFGVDLGQFLGPFIGGVIFSMTGSYALMYVLMVVPVGLAMLMLALTSKRYEENMRKANDGF
jgi:MFS family permease